jgi:hypothetical protein
MMGENLLYTSDIATATSNSHESDWPLHRQASRPEDQHQQLETQSQHEHRHPRHESETASSLSTGTERGEGDAGEKGRRCWDGFGEDGCRHVRWKGLDA